MGIDLAVTLRVMSHELRTPIGVMQGYLRMLADGRVGEDVRPRVISQLQQATTRLAQLTKQAADLAHWSESSGPAQTAEVAAAEILADAHRRLGTETTLPVDVHADPNLRVPTSDPQALASATTALVDAALRRSGQAVSLRAHALPESGLEIWAGPAQAGMAGIPLASAAESRPIDFEQGGLGLSLLLASAIVSAHGGDVWCRGDGLILGMTLPGAPQP